MFHLNFPYRSFFKGIMFLCFSLVLTSLDTSESLDLGYRNKVEKHREKLHKEFLDPTRSPFSEEEREVFHNLDYYPISKAYRVKAKLELTPDARKFDIPTSDPNIKKPYVKYGILHFELFDEKLSLHVYRNLRLSQMPGYKDHLFLPFIDATSGDETYGGGRYLDLKVPKNNIMVIDFNYVYNPYCAYGGGFSCPIPPAENRLNVPIRAGVKYNPVDH